MTLIEVTASLVLLGTLLVAILLASGRHSRQVRLAQQRLAAVRAANELLTHWYARGGNVPLNESGDVLETIAKSDARPAPPTPLPSRGRGELDDRFSRPVPLEGRGEFDFLRWRTVVVATSEWSKADSTSLDAWGVQKVRLEIRGEHAAPESRPLTAVELLVPTPATAPRPIRPEPGGGR